MIAIAASTTAIDSSTAFTGALCALDSCRGAGHSFTLTSMTAPTSTLSLAFGKARESFGKRAQLSKWRADPVAWVEQRLGGFLWSKQREIFASLGVHKRTAVKSGHGIGKSYLAALASAWWIETHAHMLEDTIVITTAPSNDQVTGVIWENIRKLHAQHKLLGVVSERAEWKDDHRNIIGKGRKPADGNTTAFQGRHYLATLIIIDEAAGVNEDIFEVVEAISTTDTCRVLAIGNPTDPNTMFGKIFLGNGGRGLDSWNKMTVSVLDSPNFTGEEVPSNITASLVHESYVKDLLDRCGGDRSAPDYLARVLGEFPEASESSLFPIQLLYQAQDTVLPEPDMSLPEHRVLGVDVARFGADSNSVVLNVEGEVTILDVYKNKRGKENAQHIHKFAVEHKVTEVRVDATGVGASTVDHLIDLAPGYGYQVIEMFGSAQSPDPKRWYNARAFWHDNVRQMMYAGTVKLPSSATSYTGQQLFNEMAALRYRIDPVRQSLLIESKDDMKRRGVKSPDISDSVTYALAPLYSNSDLMAGTAPGDMLIYDPYADDETFALNGWAISPV